MSDHILGIDIGTSSAKAALLDLSTFKLIHENKKFYENTPLQDPEMIWEKTVEAIKGSAAGLNKNNNIRAAGLSGQMHGTVLFDSEGSLLGPIINWQDERCNRPLKKYGLNNTVEVIEKMLGLKGIEELGISKMASGFLGATLFYLKENNKKLFNKIRHAVFPVDFIRGKLLGKNNYATDQTNAFGSGLFNTRLNKWHDKFIEELKLPMDIFPEVHYTTEIAGYISEKVLTATGLKQSFPVIYGGGDSQMGIFGSGAASNHFPLSINIGTAAQISKVITGYKKIEGIDTRSFFDGLYCMVGATLGGGKSYEWLKNEVNKKKSKTISYADMDHLAAAVKPGSDDLHFNTGPSRENVKRKKGFYGNLEYISSTAHKCRAVMEGVLFDLFDFYRLFDEVGCNDFIIGTGDGILNSKVWAQIAADLFGRKIKIPDHENSVFGCALLAASGTGFVKDLDEVFDLIDYSLINPDPHNLREYKKILEKPV